MAKIFYSGGSSDPIRSAPCAVIQLSDLCGVLSNEVSNYVGQEYNESMNCQVAVAVGRFD